MSWSDLDPDEAIRWLEDNRHAVVLDVRTAREFERRHIPGSQNLPLAHLGDAIQGLDLRHARLVVCEHGVRSVTACEILTTAAAGDRRMDVGPVRNLRGGLVRWIAAGGSWTGRDHPDRDAEADTDARANPDAEADRDAEVDADAPGS